MRKESQFINGILNEKKKMKISTKLLPENPVKLTKKKLKKYLKQTNYTYSRSIFIFVRITNIIILYKHCGLLYKYRLQHAK